jgi:hypothetical protein
MMDGNGHRPQQRKLPNDHREGPWMPHGITLSMEANLSATTDRPDAIVDRPLLLPPFPMPTFGSDPQLFLYILGFSCLFNFPID